MSTASSTPPPPAQPQQQRPSEIEKDADGGNDVDEEEAHATTAATVTEATSLRCAKPPYNPPALNLTRLSARVDAAWDRVAQLQAAVSRGAALLEGESVRLSVESASRAEELRLVTSLTQATEERCSTHQQRLTYHFRLSAALDASHAALLEEEAVVEEEISRLKASAREAQLQANLANNAVCSAVEAVSGMRVELWTLRRELAKANEAVEALRARQWGLEDAVDAAASALHRPPPREEGDGGLFDSLFGA